MSWRRRRLVAAHAVVALCGIETCVGIWWWATHGVDGSVVVAHIIKVVAFLFLAVCLVQEDS